MITEQLCAFETCRLAKLCGFDEECMHSWEWYTLDGKEYGPLAHAKKPIDFREWTVSERDVERRPLLYNKVFWPERNSQLQPWLYARPTLDMLETWLREAYGVRIAMVPIEGERWVSYLRPDHPGRGSWGKFDTYVLAKEKAIMQVLTHWHIYGKNKSAFHGQSDTGTHEVSG
jgi:hypothetical protein